MLLIFVSSRRRLTSAPSVKLKDDHGGSCSQAHSMSKTMVMILRPLLTLKYTLFLLAAVLPAHAQYLINLKLDKNTYLAQEPVLATVTVTNRSGADAILGGTKDERWLSFDVTSPTGIPMPPLAATSSEPMIFPAGQTLTRQFYITETHAFEEQGNYGVKATAYHGGSGQYYESNRCRVEIIDVKPFMPPMTFGVPQGFPEAGRSRDYVLLMFRDMERSYMYVRLVDKPTKTNLKTYKLGTLSLQREPQVTVDNKNQLHVMFLTTPDLYAYFIIQPDGKTQSKQIIKETAESRPKLFLTSSNEVILRGGFPYDPEAEKVKAQADKPRSISQRPPGL
jgi:hypothetical protein